MNSPDTILTYRKVPTFRFMLQIRHGVRRGAATNWFPIGKKFAEMGLKGRKMAENGHEMIDDGGPLVMM